MRKPKRRKVEVLAKGAQKTAVLRPGHLPAGRLEMREEGEKSHRGGAERGERKAARKRRRQT